MTEEKQNEKAKPEPKYKLGEVITGTAPMIMVDGKPITELEALVLALNKLDEMEKKLG